MIRSRRVAPVVLIALAAMAGCDGRGGATAAGRAYPSPKPSVVALTTRAHQAPLSLLTSAIAAMLAKGSVHLDCTGFDPGDDVTASSDEGVDSGSAVDITTTDGTQKSLVVAGVFYAYVSSSSVLVSDGFPASVAAKMAGKWLSFQPGDSYGRVFYPSTVSGLTLESMAEQLQLTGTFKSVPPKTTDGQMTVGVSGGMSASYGTAAKSSQETVYVRSTGDPLPVSVSWRISGVVQTCDFSRWGEPLQLTAPPHAVPVTSLPSDGTSG